MKIFITATDTNVGKTYLTCKLLEHLENSFAKKPIETGIDANNRETSDTYKIENKLEDIYKKEISKEDINLYTFPIAAAPFISDKNMEIDIEKLKSFSSQKNFKYNIIEGAGGIMVPISKDYYMLDFIKSVSPELTIVVSDMKLGCINRVLLSSHILKQNNINHITLFNNMGESEDEYKKITEPFINTLNQKIFYISKITNLIEYIRKLS